jgi:hypothetical protein
VLNARTLGSEAVAAGSMLEGVERPPLSFNDLTVVTLESPSLAEVTAALDDLLENIPSELKKSVIDITTAK